MKVWQIACGKRGRYYEDIFLDHDVMFLGPGNPGRYGSPSYKKAVADGKISEPHQSRVKSFSLGVQPGDLVLLRKGYRVLSIGAAAGNSYDWNESLDDVFGWDLQHCRFVSWHRDLDAELASIQATRPLFEDRKQIPTFTAVKDDAVLDPIKHLFGSITPKPTGRGPEVPKPLTMNELGEKLFGRGLPNRSVEEVLTAMQRQQRLMSWYGSQDKALKRPTEHEVVAHMVLPLLLALGWSEQLLAIEWNNIDLAAFSDTPTTKERCVLLCEAKQIGQGMQDVWEQAHSYWEKLSLSGCHKILLTDGARFYLYERRRSGDWPELPTGYLNVMRIREEHIAPKGTNAVATIMALTPRNLAAG